jgi:hypothetical protein
MKEARALIEKYEPLARRENQGPGFLANLDKTKALVNASR